MLIDAHIHLESQKNSKTGFMENLDKAKVEGAVLFSNPPYSFEKKTEFRQWQARLEELMEWSEAVPNIFPFYWLDPTEKDAVLQVERAVECGVAGFKSICTHFYPGDSEPMKIWEKIAEKGKPIIFHSGILIGAGVSKYNRPLSFEDLLWAPGLRFALAHIAWPWCDECLALYAKWYNCSRAGLATSEMFIDTTRGTPEAERERIFCKLYNTGYPIEDNLLFGTDLRSSYKAEVAAAHIAKDTAILNKLCLAEEEKEKYFGKNLLRFVANGNKGGSSLGKNQEREERR